jgi:hypothetical protein
MRALVHAELLKVRSRTVGWLLFATLAMAALTVAVSVPKAGDHDAPVPLDDPDVLTVVVGGSLGVPLVLVVLLGGLAFTQEFRYGTATSTYLGEPRRARVLLAKLLSQLVTSVIVTLATLAVAVPFTIALIASRNGDVTVSTRFWQMVVAAFAIMAAYTFIGVALGVLIRNQIIVVVATLVWMLAVEWTVIPSFPSVGRWMPGATTHVLLDQLQVLDLEGKLLPTPGAVLLLLGYTALPVALAVFLTPKRDVL